MREYYVNWHSIGMDDRTHHPGYGTRGSNWFERAPDARTAASRVSNTGLVQVTSVREIPCAEVLKAEHDSFEALKVALRERGRL